MKLQKTTRFPPACLPGPGFQDSNVRAILAGYGKYFRASCQPHSAPSLSGDKTSGQSSVRPDHPDHSQNCSTPGDG